MILDAPVDLDEIADLFVDGIDSEERTQKHPVNAGAPIHGASPLRSCRTVPSRSSSHEVGASAGRCARRTNPTLLYRFSVPSISLNFRHAAGRASTVAPMPTR
jgi:hypothetical protein